VSQFVRQQIEKKDILKKPRNLKKVIIGLTFRGKPNNNRSTVMEEIVLQITRNRYFLYCCEG